MTLFFFSSRRRHTRFDCDWSSDVCSSDLASVPSSVCASGFSTKTCQPRRSAARAWSRWRWVGERSEEHTSELQSQSNLVCRLLLEKKKNQQTYATQHICRNVDTAAALVLM